MKIELPTLAMLRFFPSDRTTVFGKNRNIASVYCALAHMKNKIQFLYNKGYVIAG